MQLDKTLVQDLMFSLIAPWAFYLVAATWFRIVGKKFTGTGRNVALSTTLGFIVYGLALTGYAEFETIKAMWFGSPYTLCGLLVIFGIFAPVALIYLTFRIWRPRQT